MNTLVSSGKLPPLNRRNHALTCFVLGLLERHLGLQIRLHGLNEQFAFGGGIVIANHFTRLETFLIPYVLHRELGISVRVMAASMLFTRKVFGDYLRSIGGFPTNHPNKYDLIARDILRGGWWLIFPEGSMIKDRKVVENGRLDITTDYGMSRRRPRSGAAILTLTVQHYKDMLRQALQSGRDLTPLCAALGLTDLSRGHLEAVAYSPTSLVPLNLTYYPLHPAGSVVKSLATRLMPTFCPASLGRRLLEELAVEGSMLLKGVEIDMRFGLPLLIEADLQPAEAWRLGQWPPSPWRRYLRTLRTWRPTPRYGVLRQSRSVLATWHRRRRAWYVTRTAMRAIYKQTTVNMDHLLAVLLFLGWVDDRRQRFAVADLKHRVYVAVQELRTRELAYLHASLGAPHLQRLLTDTPHPAMEDFARRAEADGLLTRQGESWLLTTDLCHEWSFETVRLKNFIQVCVNEIEPLPEVLQVMRQTLHTDASHLRDSLGEARFAYEQHLYDIDYTTFAAASSCHLPALPYDAGRPVLLRGTGKTGAIGILLVHGYSASPGEVLPLARILHARGFTVYVVRLRGHGTSPVDLQQRSWREWYASVLRGYHSLRAITDVQFAGGMSTGGALALYLAAQDVGPLQGVFAVGAPLKLQHWAVRLAALVGSVRDFVPSQPENPATNYRYQPLRALQQLLRFIAVYQTHLERITHPVLLVQARRDPTVRPESAQSLYDRLGSRQKHLIWKDVERHVIVGADFPDVHHDILTFLCRHSPLAIPDGGPEAFTSALSPAAAESWGLASLAEYVWQMTGITRRWPAAGSASGAAVHSGTKQPAATTVPPGKTGEQHVQGQRGEGDSSPVPAADSAA